MSTRRLSCQHNSWDILPGNNIRCADCGELIDNSELADWMTPGDPVTITRADIEAHHAPLTHRLGDHIISR